MTTTTTLVRCPKENPISAFNHAARVLLAKLQDETYDNTNERIGHQSKIPRSLLGLKKFKCPNDILCKCMNDEAL